MDDRLFDSSDQSTVPAHGDLDTRRDSLERRLDDGYRRLDEAALAGVDIVEWESFWIRLLGEYEGFCRERDIAA